MLFNINIENSQSFENFKLVKQSFRFARLIFCLIEKSLGIVNRLPLRLKISKTIKSKKKKSFSSVAFNRFL